MKMTLHLHNFLKAMLAVISLSVLFSALSTPSIAHAQTARKMLDGQAAIGPEILELVRASSVKATSNSSTAEPAKFKQTDYSRSRAVEIDFSVLQTTLEKMADASVPQLIRISFFEDAELLAEITDVSTTSSGGLAYTGRVPGVMHSSVVLVHNQGVVSINVSALSKQFAIHGSGESGYVASELRRLNLPDHTSKPIRVDAPITENQEFQPAADASVAADTGPQIDVMVVYTPVVRVNNGGTAQMHANIDAQVAFTNLIYANSNVVQRLRLVYKGEVAYTETTDSVDLSRLRNPNDGFMDSVPVLRDIYKADFVSLWGNYPTTCGLGYLMSTESSGFTDSAYNTVNSPGCTGSGSATFAHELGHNMGVDHDNFVTMDSPTSIVTPEAGGPATEIRYAHGYVDIVNRFRTVMAYDDHCFATPPFTACDRTPHFSNPNVLYTGFPTGNATNAHDRQAMNDTLETTRNFRTGLPASAFTGPGILVLTPASVSVSEGAGSVQLTVERHVGFTGAVSVNFTTASGTATAGADFTTTSGTLTWASGDATSKTISVPILQDTLLEGKESFTVTLSAPDGGVSVGALGGTTTSATVTIIDDEPDTFPVGGTIPTGYVTPAASSAAWTVDLTDGYLSPNSLQSAAVLGTNSNQLVYVNSDLEYTSTFLAGDVSFAYRVSSLGTSFANLEFMVDGAVVFSSAGGDTGWLTRTQAVTAGTHTLRWRFKNRITFSCARATSPVPPPNCADRAWIDSVVLPLALSTSTTIVSSSVNPSILGQSVTFTATIAGSAGTPTGSVAFTDGGIVISGCAAIPVSNGSAQCVTSGLQQGVRAISGQYTGSGSYNASTSTTLIQTVNAGVFPLVPIFMLLL